VFVAKLHYIRVRMTAVKATRALMHGQVTSLPATNLDRYPTFHNVRIKIKQLRLELVFVFWNRLPPIRLHEAEPNVGSP
jgi:hypothetical protein